MIVLPTEKKPNINAPPTILPKWNRKALEKGWKHSFGLLKYQFVAIPDTQKLTELLEIYRIHGGMLAPSKAEQKSGLTIA